MSVYIYINFDNFMSVIITATQPPESVQEHLYHLQLYGTPEGTFLFQYLQEEKLKQKELEKKSKQ